MPAAAGDMLQPETSRSTSRKSAATRPPESSSNAALALKCGRRRVREVARARSARCERRENERHLHEEDRLPAEQLRQDAAGARPEAPRRGRPQPPRCAPRGPPPVVSASSSRAATTTNAAPDRLDATCATSSSNDVASPHASEAPAKISAPATNARRGRRRATNAAGTRDRARARG